MKHLLIVDDERGSRESLKAIFSSLYRLSLAETAAQAAQLLSEKPADLILLDVMMPEKNGLAFLKEIQETHPDLPVIMVSASTSIHPVVQAIREGAYDFVTKPFDVEEIRKTVARALESSTLQRQVRVLKTDIQREFPIENMVGSSATFKQAMEHARKVAESDATVLIQGESGTGKELVARSIHAWSDRKDEPFVAVHCAALPEALMESELFGHEKGAFTSADKQKPGRFDLAGSGTLFFDEVSEMSLSTQVKLLRVIQEREFMRVGGIRVIRTNARIVAASAKDLREEVRAKRFRDDLFYRLSVVPISLPPLRERPGDIQQLVHHFFADFKHRLDAHTVNISEEALTLLCQYPWPGNVRELRNIIERLLVLHGKEAQILPRHLPEEFLPATASVPNESPPAKLTGKTTLEESVRNYERQLIEQALKEAQGVQTTAAQLLGTTRRILKYRMEQMNLRYEKSKKADRKSDNR